MNRFPTVGQIVRLVLIAAFVAPLLIGPIFSSYSDQMGILVAELAIFVLVVAFIRRGRLVPEDVLLLNATPGLVLVVTAGVALCASLVISEFEVWNDALLQQFDLQMPLGLQQSMLEIQVVRDVWDLGLLMAAVVVAPGVSEELLFRGVVFTGLLVNRGPRSAVLGSALLFAVVHFRPWQLPALALFGLFLSALVYWTHSIYPAILAHLINNLASVAAVNLEVYWGLEIFGGDHHLSLLGTFTLGLMTAYGLLWIRRQRAYLPLPGTVDVRGKPPAGGGQLPAAAESSRLDP